MGDDHSGLHRSMNKEDLVIPEFGNDAHMSYGFIAAGPAVKKHQVTRARIPETDEPAQKCHASGRMRQWDIKMVEDKSRESTAVKAPGWFAAITIWLVQVTFCKAYQ